MVFSSLTFLYCFLPLTLTAYFVVPARWKNAVILVMSLAFYFYGGQFTLFLMLGDILFAYSAGLLLDRFEGKKKKVILVLFIAGSLVLLGIFKYADLFVSAVNNLTGTKLPLLKLALPIGISFYIFQTLSYGIDVYRGTVKAQRSLLSFAVYVSFFPQLIAGPVVRYSAVEGQIAKREVRFENIGKGAMRFVTGLGKKVLLADQLYAFASVTLNAPSSGFAWLQAAAYVLFVYFDFSGYSDMAIGLGKCFGLSFPENFRYPLISRSVREFWRRWHMTLGQWFRDYVYIPAGGNRGPVLSRIFSLALVWALTGLWHGAFWNFVLWGMYFGVLVILETFIYGKALEKLPRIFGTAYTLMAVVAGFVLFRFTDPAEITGQFRLLFGGSVFWNAESMFYGKDAFILLVSAVFAATPLPSYLVKKIRESGRAEKALTVMEPLWMIALLLLCTAFLADGTYSPFLYYRF